MMCIQSLVVRTDALPFLEEAGDVLLNRAACVSDQFQLIQIEGSQFSDKLKLTFLQCIISAESLRIFLKGLNAFGQFGILCGQWLSNRIEDSLGGLQCFNFTDELDLPLSLSREFVGEPFHISCISGQFLLQVCLSSKNFLRFSLQFFSFLLLEVDVLRQRLLLSLNRPNFILLTLSNPTLHVLFSQLVLLVDLFLQLLHFCLQLSFLCSLKLSLFQSVVTLKPSFVYLGRQ